MRRFVALAAFAVSPLALSACSDNAADTAATAEPTATVAAATDMAPATATVLNANDASAEQLAGVAGVTPELAAAIVAGRPYADVTAFNTKLRETLDADGAAKVLTGVFVPVNLNAASEAEIKLIPGMTEKMEHEFMEYRPYADMGVFDREIGKYVDQAEVARFRNYVTL